MIGNRISPKFPLTPKMSCASGTPIASVFFTEQNRAAMKSSLCNLAALEAAQTNSETVANSATTPINTLTVMPMP